MAEGGSLLLDEIGDAADLLRTKPPRVLQELIGRSGHPSCTLISG